MKKTSNWILAAIIGGVLVVSLILIGDRLNGKGLPIASMTFAPQDSQTPATGADSPAPNDTGTDPVESQTPATVTETPSPAAQETGPVETPAAATVFPGPTATGTEPDPSTATGTPSPTPTEADPVESEEPAGFIGPMVLVVEADYIIDVVDLGAVTENYTKVYDSIFGGSNTVEFAPGDARVIEATCPDHVCISEGWVIADMGGFLPVACLPNSMMLYAVSAEELFGTGVDGATQ